MKYRVKDISSLSPARAFALCNSIFLLFLLPLSAQELPRIINFTQQAYAAQNQTWAIAQAPTGTLFFANNEALLEFDGARWRKFHLPEGQTVRSVACKDGKVFAGGFAEFGCFEHDPATKWRYHSLSQNLQSDKARREEIWHILVPSNHQSPVTNHQSPVFFQSFSTIFQFDGKKTTQVQPPSNLMFLQQVGERLIFQGIGKGLYEMLPGGGFRFLEGSEMLAGSIVAFILPEANGRLLIGTKNHGIFKCEASGKCQPWANQLNQKLKLLQLNKAVCLADGGIAIGTILDGVFILDSLENLRFHLNQKNGLQNNTVLSMLCDRSGNLWLGLDKGIDLVELNSPLRWFSDRTGSIGAVYSAAVTEGKLYVGTNQGVFFKNWKPASNSPKASGGRTAEGENFKLIPGTQGQVWQLQVFENQLLCGHNEGTFAIKNGVATKISSVTGGWKTLPVPGREDLLIQGTYVGLAVFKKDPFAGWQFSHQVEGFPDPVKKMAFDGGYIWLAHPNRGLWRVKLSGDLRRIAEIRQFTTEDGLPTEMKIDFLEKDQAGFFIRAGSALLKPENDRLIPVSKLGEAKPAKELAFPNSDRFLIFPDHLVFQSGDRRLNLPLSLIPDFENVELLATGEYLFCLENGYALLEKNAEASWSDEPQNTLAISAVEVLSNPPRWFFPAPGRVETLELKARENNLRFYFTAPFFTQQAEFQWKIGGLEIAGGRQQLGSTWLQDDQAKDIAELTNLPPGTFGLAVELPPGDSQAAEKGILRSELSPPANELAAPFFLKIRIRPPWWKTWWAIGIWLICGIVLLLSLENFYRIRLEHQRRQLRLEKERELAAQRSEAENERLQAEVDSKNRDLSNATLNLVRKNETLLALKGELQKSALLQPDLSRLDRLIEGHLSSDQDWELFEVAFNQVHDEFFKKLKADFPDLTPGDLRLAAFLKLNLSSKEIASLLGLSLRGVENKRYRLRKKLSLGEEVNLAEFLMKK